MAGPSKASYVVERLEANVSRVPRNGIESVFDRGLYGSH